MEEIKSAPSAITTERLSKRNLWCFSCGGVGRDMAYNLWNGFLLICIMYTKGISPAQLTTILLMMALCRIWDAVNDPVMGGIIERTRTKWGKFKPWIFIGAITNALVTFTIFAVPLRGRDFVIFFPFAYLLWDITYTMNDIGYWAMMPSLTSNDSDRNNITTWANILAGIGGGISGIIVPMFTTGDMAIGGNAVTGFTVTAAIIGVCFIGCQLLTAIGVKEKPLPSIASDKVGIKQMFQVIFKNDQVLWIALVMIIYNLGSSLYSASYTNFIYFRFGYQGTLVSVFGTLGGILGGVSIFYPLLAKKFNRKTISKFAILIAVVGYISMFILGSLTMKVDNTTAVFVGLVICASTIVMGQTMFYMVQTISIANTIEYNEWKTGNRDEGIIFSVRPFMAKMGSALVVVVQAIVYGILGIQLYTSGISNLENDAALLYDQTSMQTVMADEAASAAYNEIAAEAGTTYEGAFYELINANNGSPEGITFSDVISKLKSTGVENILARVNSNTKVWMLFAMTIIPMVFVVGGYLVWKNKFKIDEKKYCEILAEIEQKKATDSGEHKTDMEPVEAEAAARALGADFPESQEGVQTESEDVASCVTEKTEE